MARVLMLLDVMPRNQSRKTIEDVISPHDRALGRRAVDALIEADLVSEDHAGHHRRLH
jgi:hypothetical protein